ncbi:TPA: hypothetical protein AB5C23_001313 [Vibrio cholerae]
MPSIQVTGVLEDPTTGVESDAELLIISKINYGKTTKKANRLVVLSSAGEYDFQLVHGKHLFAVKSKGAQAFTNIGTVVVGEGSPSPIDIITLITTSNEEPDPILITQLQLIAAEAAVSAAEAAQSELNAANSATAAAQSEVNAAKSESNANDSALSASTSETNAANSASGAQTSATNAAQSETNAANSASSASDSALAASTSETNAANSAIAAAQSETNAALSATNSADSAASAESDADRAEAAALVASSGVFDRGSWDASAGNFPAPTLTPEERTDWYRISVAGVMSDGVQPDVEVKVSDNLYWDKQNNVWYKIDNTDAVNSVNGKQGDVIIVADDISDVYSKTETYSKSEVDAAIGGLTQDPNLFLKSIGSEPAFLASASSISAAFDIIVAVGGSILSFSSSDSVSLPSLISGTDYAIYATADGLIASDNFTVPSGYTESNSRRIGGFHYQDAFINSRSVWDLKYKPSCSDPRGMARTIGGFWADIYLLNATPDVLGTSAYNATIADGNSTPVIPQAWGGDGTSQYSTFTQYVASEVLSAYGKRLPNYSEFSVLAMGATAGYAAGTDPVTTKFDARARSTIGCEQVSGHMGQWGAENWDRGNGSSGYAWYAANTNGEGQVYTAGDTGVGASLFGGFWTYSGFAGSRCSNWSTEPWVSAGYLGARGVCDHLQLV